MKKITLQEGLEFCREIEERLVKIGYHCGLTGSILYKGESEKDIDIIIYPHQVSKQLPVNHILGVIGAHTNMYLNQGNKVKDEIVPSCTDKVIVVADYKKVRVDLFFLS